MSSTTCQLRWSLAEEQVSCCLFKLQAAVPHFATSILLPFQNPSFAWSAGAAGKPRGYAFIEFEHKNDMKTAYKMGDGKKIEGRRVLVDVERGRTVPNWYAQLPAHVPLRQRLLLMLTALIRNFFLLLSSLGCRRLWGSIVDNMLPIQVYIACSTCMSPL